MEAASGLNDWLDRAEARSIGRPRVFRYSVGSLHLELNTQSMHEFEYGFVPWLGTRGEGFIKTFARNACVFG